MSVKTKRFKAKREVIHISRNTNNARRLDLIKRVRFNNHFRTPYFISVGALTATLPNDERNISTWGRVRYILETPRDDEGMYSNERNRAVYEMHGLYIDPYSKIDFCKDTDTIVSECDEYKASNNNVLYLYFNEMTGTQIKIFASQKIVRSNNTI